MTKEEKLQIVAPLLLKICQRILWRLENNSDLPSEIKYESIKEFIGDMSMIVDCILEDRYEGIK